MYIDITVAEQYALFSVFPEKCIKCDLDPDCIPYILCHVISAIISIHDNLYPPNVKVGSMLSEHSDGSINVI